MYRFIDTTPTIFINIERTPLPFSENGAGASVFEDRLSVSEETASSCTDTDTIPLPLY